MIENIIEEAKKIHDFCIGKNIDLILFYLDSKELNFREKINTNEVPHFALNLKYFPQDRIIRQIPDYILPLTFGVGLNCSFETFKKEFERCEKLKSFI